MDWNPFHHVENAIKDFSHVVSDVTQTSERLSQEAFDLVTGPVKDAGKVVSDIASGNLIDAGKDVLTADKNLLKRGVTTAVDLGKGAYHTVDDTKETIIEGVTAVDPLAGRGLRLSNVFFESALNTAILKPVDGLVNLDESEIHALTGYQLPKLDLHLTPNEEGLGAAGKVAQYAGDVFGFVAPIVLTAGVGSVWEGAGLAGDAAEAGTIFVNSERVYETTEAINAATSAPQLGSSGTQLAALPPGQSAARLALPPGQSSPVAADTTTSIS